MKKKLVALLSILVLLALAASCSSNKDTETETAETKTIGIKESGILGESWINIKDKKLQNKVTGESENDFIKVSAKEISNGYFSLKNEKSTEFLDLEHNKEYPYIRLNVDITNKTDKEVTLFLMYTYVVLEDGEQVLCKDILSGIGSSQIPNVVVAPSATVKDVNMVFLPSRQVENIGNLNLYISKLNDTQGYDVENSNLFLNLSVEK